MVLFLFQRSLIICNDNYSVLGNDVDNYKGIQLWLRINSAKIEKYMGSSTKTVAFHEYEILKINLEFLQFSWLGLKI